MKISFRLERDTVCRINDFKYYITDSNGLDEWPDRLKPTFDLIIESVAIDLIESYYLYGVDVEEFLDTTDHSVVDEYLAASLDNLSKREGKRLLDDIETLLCAENTLAVATYRVSKYLRKFLTVPIEDAVIDIDAMIGAISQAFKIAIEDGLRSVDIIDSLPSIRSLVLPKLRGDVNDVKINFKRRRITIW